MWQMLAKTTAVSLIPKLVDKAIDAVTSIFEEDKPIKSKLYRKATDVTKFTQLDYREVTSQLNHMKTFNDTTRFLTTPPGDKITQAVLCERLNELLGLDKSVSAYRTLWRMTDLSELPTGGSNLKELVAKRKGVVNEES